MLDNLILFAAFLIGVSVGVLISWAEYEFDLFWHVRHRLRWLREWSKFRA